MSGEVSGTGQRDDAAQRAAAERAAQQAEAQRAAQQAAQQAQQLGSQLKSTTAGAGSETSKVGVATSSGASSMARPGAAEAARLQSPATVDQARPRPSAPNARPSFPTPGSTAPRAPAPKPAAPPTPPRQGEPPATGTRTANAKQTESGAQLTAGIGGTVQAGPLSLSAQANVSAEVSRRTESGVTNISLDTRASLTVSGEINAKGASLEASRTDSLTARVEVQVPAAKEAQLGDVRNLNPMDPSKLPTGTRVTMEGARNTDTQLNATFRGLAVETSTGRSEGTSLQVEKLEGDKVRVTAGPSEAMRQGFGVGVQAGSSSATANAAQQLSTEKLRSAEFDLSTQQGRDAYQNLVRTGQFPTQEGTGVSNVTTTEKVKYDQQISGEVNVAGKALLQGSQQTSADLTKTSRPDGSFTLTGNLNPAGNVPLQASASFDPQGKEIPGSREYSYSVPPMDKDQAYRFAQATNPPGSPAPSREQVHALMQGGATLKFNQEQMQAFRDQAVQAARGDPSFANGLVQSPQVGRAQGLVPRPAESFATQLSMGHGAGRANAEAFISNMFSVNQRTGRPISATVTPGE